MAAKKKYKTGPLTKQEKDFIMSNKETMSLEAIALKLKRRLVSIVKAAATPEQEKTIEVKKKDDYIMNSLLARRPDRGVVTMTESASMYMDEKKSTTTKVQPPYIHKFRPDE